MRIELIGLEKFPEIKSGDNLSSIIIETCKKNSIQLRNNDIIVISQKIISKSENQIININNIKPTSYAKKIALKLKKDPRIIEVILSESEEVIRISDSVIITKTKHGFICANSGVDNSNISEGLILLLLPMILNHKTINIPLTLGGNVQYTVHFSDMNGPTRSQMQPN